MGHHRSQAVPVEYVDAVAGFIPGTLTGGNFKTLYDAPNLIAESTTFNNLTFNVLNTYAVGKSFLDVYNAATNKCSKWRYLDRGF